MTENSRSSHNTQPAGLDEGPRVQPSPPSLPTTDSVSKRPRSSDSASGSPKKRSTLHSGPDDESQSKESDKTERSSQTRSHSTSDVTDMTAKAPHPACTVGETEFSALSLQDFHSEAYSSKVGRLPRQWERTQLGEHYLTGNMRMLGNSRQPVTFNVMTYNILAPDLMNFHPDLYYNCGRDSFDWNVRRRRLMAEIAYYHADIVNLQEIQEDHYNNYFKPRMERLGYQGCYQKRTGDKSDGCATLWKGDKFDLLSCAPVTYCRGGLLDRDNIALLVELRPRRPTHTTDSSDPHDKLVVANTHLLFNPRRGDIKLAQIMILLAEIDLLAHLPASSSQPPSPSPSPSPTQPSSNPSSQAPWGSCADNDRYCPVIMTGDFNMEPHSDLYKLVVSGSLQYEGLVVKDMSGQEEGYYGRTVFLQQEFLSPSYGVTDLCQYRDVVVKRLQQSYHAYCRDVQTRQGDGDDKCTHSQHNKCPQTTTNTEHLHQCPPDKLEQTVTSKREQSHHSKPSCEKDGSSQHSIDTKNSQPLSVTEAQNKICSNQTENTTSSAPQLEVTKPNSLSLSPSTPQPDITNSNSLPMMPSCSGSVSHSLNLVSAYEHVVRRLGGEEGEVTTHHGRTACTVDYIFYSVDFKQVCVDEDEQVKVRVLEEGHLKLLGRYGLMSETELDQTRGIPNAVLPSDHLCLIAHFLLL